MGFFVSRKLYRLAALLASTALTAHPVLAFDNRTLDQIFVPRSALAAVATSGKQSDLSVTGCIEAETYGASPALSDNTPALLRAKAALPVMSGGCIVFGHGVYNFSREVDLPLASGAYSLMIRGAGQTMTRLNWTGVTNGLVFQQNNQFNTSHVRDLSITTAAGSTATSGVTFTTTAYLGVLSNSDVTNVTFKGADGGNSSNYWGAGLRIHGVSYVNVVNPSFIGGYAGSGTTHYGTGAVVEGDLASQNYTIVVNFTAPNFQDEDVGLLYGAFVQGVTVDQANFQNGRIGISSVAANGNNVGILALMAVTNSQFGGLTTAGIQPQGGTVLDQLQVTNNTFYVTANGNGVDLSGGAQQTVITGNAFQGDVNTSNAVLFGKTQGMNLVTSNTLTGFVNGIWLQTTSSGVLAEGNVFGTDGLTDVTTPVLDQGTNDIVTIDQGGVKQIYSALQANNLFTAKAGVVAPGLPTSGGTVKGTLCVDTSGVVYVKTTVGACL